MLATNIMVTIWLVIALVILLGLIYLNYKFIISNRNTKKQLEKYVKLVEKRTKDKYNRIATLPIEELNMYLTNTFSMILELVSISDISENDPKASTKLYSISLLKMIDYIGNETIEALNFYYGEGYLIKWCEIRYKILENRGVLKNVIQKDVYAESIKESIK